MKITKPPVIVQMTSTPHHLAVRTDTGRVIVWDGNTWKEITPRWREDGGLINTP